MKFKTVSRGVVHVECQRQAIQALGTQDPRLLWGQSRMRVYGSIGQLGYAVSSRLARSPGSGRRCRVPYCSVTTLVLEMVDSPCI